MQYHFDRATADEWFQDDALVDIDDVEFTVDIAGNWTGSWTTPDSQVEQMLMDEDIGFVFEGLDLVASENPPTTTFTDDASLQSFGTAFGRPLPLPPSLSNNSTLLGNSQSEGSATPPASSDAAATQGGAGQDQQPGASGSDAG